MPIILTKKANEESTYVIRIDFYDEDGLSLVPNTVVWTLTDSDGTVMNSRTAVAASAAARVNITLSGNDLALPTVDTKRILYISSAYDSLYGTNLPLNEEVEFDIEPLVNVT